jgi:hypothetical protein
MINSLYKNNLQNSLKRSKLAKNENEINMMKELDIMRADALTKLWIHGQLKMEAKDRS